MQVSTQQVLCEEPGLTQVAFGRLLAWLDDGLDSHGERYLEMRRRLVAYFDRRNRLNVDELADETLTRIGRTLEQDGHIDTTPPARYCYVVARLLVVEEDICGRVEPIALASFDAVDDATVELGIVVRDDWQNHRIGTTLATRILDAAEASGFHRFVATIHSHNEAIRRLLRHVGVVVSSTFEAGVCEMAFIRRPQ